MINVKVSSDELKVFGKGLNFAVAFNPLKAEDVIPSKEVALSEMDKTTSDEQVGAQCDLSLKHWKTVRIKISQEEIPALQRLENDKNTVIYKLDKGNTTVVMDMSDYIRHIRLINILEYAHIMKFKHPWTLICIRSKRPQVI
ncbi:unnamed protein product [Trichobilharzia regenti]|nr:unnamed protein product [Trichobilharzia regenti]